jgi:phosphoadenosine phosphosulfate reductase
LRADQSEARGSAAIVGVDAGRQLLKVSPFLDYSRADILAIATENNVPLNPLHDRGFVSIGCAPCTRAVKPGEVERSGRWWWEDESKKECGLHVPPAETSTLNRQRP